MKKVSVIIPVYNVEKYLEDSLMTLVNQSYSNLEILCIDDGSTDKSPEILEKMAALDSRIHVFHQKNSGPSIARNFALEICSGDYITFMDSDELLEYTYIEELVSALEKNNADISVCGHICVYPKFKQTIHARKNRLLTQKEALAMLLSDLIIKNYSWGKCYRKEVWKDVRYPEHCYYEDVLTIYKTFLNAHSVALITKPLYRYLIRSNSITNEIPKTRAIELKQAYQKQEEDIIAVYPDLKKAAIFPKITAQFMIFTSKFRKNAKKGE